MFFLLMLLLKHEGRDVVIADKRTKSTLSLLEDVCLLEVVLQLSSALDAGVADLTDLHWIETVPFVVVEVVVEVRDELGADEVKKSIADVAIVLDKQGVHYNRWADRKNQTSSCGSSRTAPAAFLECIC